jgi:aldose 1-epimerase
VTTQPFGTLPDGSPVESYTIGDGSIEARVIPYGAIVVSLRTPDRNGKLDDIVLGFDDAAGYFANNNGGSISFFGSVVGRYANRIAHGSFTLDGKKYSLPKNNGDNTLHGGPKGFFNVLWTARSIANGMELTYLSKDGEAGFPGDLSVTVRYIARGGALRVEYSAVTDKPTVVNLTQHSYFNLEGQGNGDIVDHQLTLYASRFTPVDAGAIPAGALQPVKGTAFDFLNPTRVGERIESNDHQVKLGNGYDHNWVVDGKMGELREAAELYAPKSGRVLKVRTTEPGIQFYSGNFLSGARGKGGKTYPRRSGLCLETQHFPDSPNRPDFPSTVLRPGDKFQSVTEFAFSAR